MDDAGGRAAPLTTTAPAPSRNPARDRLVIVVLCCALWLPGMVTRTLWHPDEPRFALIARTMIQTGEYVVPTKMGRTYDSKPPLYLWTATLASRVVGRVSEISMRIPSFLAGLGGVLMTHALASAFFGGNAGVLAALVLASDVRFLTQAQWASTDMLLCFFMTGALVAFQYAYRGGGRRWYMVMYVMCGLGALTKGPVGFVLPGAVILCHLAVSRDLAEIRRMKLLPGVLIVAALLGPWLSLYWLGAGSEHASSLLLEESVTRYLNAWNNEHPWHYFLWRFPVDFLPWFVLFPAAVWYAASQMPRKERSFLFCWFGVIFIFYSISTGKRGVYILPIHAAAAVMVAWFWEHVATATRWADWGRRLTGALFLLPGAAMVAATPVALGLPAGVDRVWLVVSGSLTAAAGFAIMMLSPKRTIAAVAAAMVLVVLAGALLAVPAANEDEALSEFAADIARGVPVDAPFGIVTHREEFAFYAGRTPVAEIRRGKLMETWLATPGTSYMVLDEPLRDDLASRTGLPFSWEVLAEGVFSRGHYYLIVKRGLEAPG